jgi:hypothetical protein
MPAKVADPGVEDGVLSQIYVGAKGTGLRPMFWSHALRDQEPRRPDGTTDHRSIKSHAGTPRVFTIRAVESCEDRSQAAYLVRAMYATRGYRIPEGLDEPDPSRLTLIAHDQTLGHAVGTLTIGFDGRGGLLCDELFHDKVDTLRQRDRLCEFTKLAMDPDVQSSRVLTGLFYVAYLYAHRIHGADRVLIEVNPRHVGFYRRKLGFGLLCNERMNARVQAPAVLMGLDFRDGRRWMGRGIDGGVNVGRRDRSLYTGVLQSVDEEHLVAAISGQAGQPMCKAGYMVAN